MMLVAGQNYIDSSGSAIQCMQDKGNGKKELLLFWWEWVWWCLAFGCSGVPGKIMNNYCWIMSTYTLPRLWDVSSPHPNILASIVNCHNILRNPNLSVSEWMGSYDIWISPHCVFSMLVLFVLTIILIQISAGRDQYWLHPSWSWPSWRWCVETSYYYWQLNSHSFASALTIKLALLFNT